MGNVKHEMADVSGINGSQEIHKIHSKSRGKRGHLPFATNLLYWANSIEMLVPRGQAITT